MQLQYLRHYAYLMRTFRNGWELVRRYRRQEPCHEAVLWNGARLRHPPGVGGLVGTILEIWWEQCYTPDGFYRPRAGDAIIDIGAHVGMFSIWMVRQNPGCRVLALEPTAENYAYLQENLRAMGAHQVDARQCAIGGRPGMGRLESRSKRSIDYRLREVEDDGDGAVPILSLAQVVDQVGSERIAMLKMDVEGAEYDAFSTATPDTLERIDRLALEYHDHLRPGTLDLLRAVLDATHRITVHPTFDRGYGVLLARRR